jgi:ABC-type amino acid transport substrate-binding protein
VKAFKTMVLYTFLILGIVGFISFLWYMLPPESAQHSLIIGTNAEFQPFTSIDKEGKVVGFDIDIAQEVCKRLGKKAVFNNMSFDALIPEIQLGTIHIIAAGMTPTPERAKHVFFTTPHLEGEPLALVVRAGDSDPDCAVYLQTKRIAVNQGYTSESYAVGSGAPHIIRLAGASVSDGILALKSNQADGYIAAVSVLKPFFAQDTTKAYRMLILPNSAESTALAVSKKYPDLYKEIESTIVQMLEDGTITALKEKWNM